MPQRIRGLAAGSILALLLGACERHAPPAASVEGPAAGANSARTAAGITPPVVAFPPLELPADLHLRLAPGAEDGWRVRELPGAPRHFLASGWIGPEVVWGLAGTRATLIDLASGTGRALEGTAWAAAAAPDGRLAWTDERGVWTGSPGARPHLLLAAGPADPTGEGSAPAALLWSPEGDRILATWRSEWDAAYAIVDARTGESMPVAARLDGYFLSEAVLWLDPGRVLFTVRASRARDGAREYGSGYRADLAVLDLATGRFERVTDVADGVFLEPVGPWGGRVLVGEAEREGPPRRFWAYDPHTWQREAVALPAGHAIAAPDGSRAVVVTATRQEGPNQVFELASWEAATGRAAPLALVRGERIRAAWSPDGRRLALGRTVAEPKAAGSDTFETRYHTEILEIR